MMVMMFHFLVFNNEGSFLVKNETVRNWSEFGAQGVEMFFIISGFVMMLSLDRKDYTIGSYGRYMLKRIVRIIPLYWTVIFAGIILSKWLWYQNPDLNNMLANMFFTVDLFEGTYWYNPIFSTLGVEMQFYIVLGLMFPLIRSNRIWSYLIFSVWIVLGYFTKDHYTMLMNAPFFIIGITLYYIYRDGNNLADWLTIFIVLCLLFWATFYDDIAVSILTIVLLMGIKITWKPLVKLGSISYSIYLSHGLTGVLPLFFFTHSDYLGMDSPWLIVLVTVTSLTGSLIAYLVVERQSMRWSKKIRLKGTSAA